MLLELLPGALWIGKIYWLERYCKIGPIARSGHMVQNHTCWWVSCTVGLPKQRQVRVDWYELLCFCKFHCATCSPACVILYFVTGSCKGPLHDPVKWPISTVQLNYKRKLRSPKKIKDPMGTCPFRKAEFRFNELVYTMEPCLTTTSLVLLRPLLNILAWIKAQSVVQPVFLWPVGDWIKVIS